MKQLISCLALMVLSVSLMAQAPKSPEKGVTYGAGTTADQAIPVQEMDAKMVDNKFSGKVKGKVVEVCQEKGCWMKLEKENGEKLMVKFKDYAFFMPKNLAGKEVVLEGDATVKEISVKQQRHYAEDAGKSKEEIKKITEPKREVIFMASGVLVL
jgi:hypothetical protein